MKKKAIVIIVFVIIISSISNCSCYGKTNSIKGTNYECLVKDNYAYCDDFQDLYKVNLTTKMVEPLKTGSGLKGYKTIKGNYLYYIEHGHSVGDSRISRININNGKYKKLAENVDIKGFVIKGSKIYYTKEVLNLKNWKTKKTHMVMKLNGKGKKKTKYNIVVSHKVSNTDGYGVYFEFVSRKTSNLKDYYLQTPIGDIYLSRNDVT